jgi:hypothetical protein
MSIASFFAGIIAVVASWFGHVPAAAIVPVASTTASAVVHIMAPATIPVVNLSTDKQAVQDTITAYLDMARNSGSPGAQLVPDPAALHFTVTINGADATAIAIMPNTSQTSSGMTVTTSDNTVTVSLDKASGRWKVDDVSMNSNGALTR